MSASRTLAATTSLKRRLAERLRSGGEILGFKEDPALSSLCTCLALEFEVGNGDFDRLGPFFGAEPTDAWEKQLFIEDGEVGLRLRRRDGKPLTPRHEDLRHLLDPSSLDDGGKLTQAVIFPRKVAATFAEKGFNLIIVRDWILSTALAEEEVVPYIHSNEWEIKNHIATTQAVMMSNNQFAFFGTHDIVDHLFGADISRFESLKPLHLQVVECFKRTMVDEARRSRPHLVLTYLIGIALDDLAQPRWYGSRTHQRVIEACLVGLEKAKIQVEDPTMPEAFHLVAAAMRAPEKDFKALQTAITLFTEEARLSG